MNGRCAVLNASISRLEKRSLSSYEIAAIGHELRHAVEVLSDPDVVDHSSLYYFYKRNRERAGMAAAFETQAATDAGEAIANEVRQFQRTPAKK